jgi:Spy/CpxP family protein refolding chaperone
MAAGKIKAILALGFTAAILAGGAAGLLLSRYVKPAPPVVATGTAPLSVELKLTADQQSQIRRIWEQVQGINESSYDAGQMLNHWRDDQVLKLLSDEQKKAFEKINSEYADRYTAMKAKRDLAFKDAVEKTKQLLNAEQRIRYEQILAKRLGQEGGNGPTQPGSTHPSETFSASAAPQGVVSPG